jgi:ATP-dependent Clp protease ATP-binding subunit ClpA
MTKERKERELANIIDLSMTEARQSGRRTVRPVHMLLALVSVKSFLASYLKESGFERETLAKVITDIDFGNYDRDTITDKVFCIIFDCLRTKPPFSAGFYRVLKWARKRSKSMNRQVITYCDLCYALLIDEPENELVRESLKRLGIDPQTIKLALESSELD